MQRLLSQSETHDMARPFAVLLLLGILLSACESDDSADFTPSQGAIVIENPGPGLWADADEPLISFDLQFAGLTGITEDNQLALSSLMFGYAGEKIHLIDLETWELLSTREVYLREEPLDEERRAVDADGALYSVSDDPFPQVRRYAVTINTPAP